MSRRSDNPEAYCVTLKRRIDPTERCAICWELFNCREYACSDPVVPACHNCCPKEANPIGRQCFITFMNDRSDEGCPTCRDPMIPDTSDDEDTSEEEIYHPEYFGDNSDVDNNEAIDWTDSEVSQTVDREEDTGNDQYINNNLHKDNDEETTSIEDHEDSEVMDSDGANMDEEPDDDDYLENEQDSDEDEDEEESSEDDEGRDANEDYGDYEEDKDGEDRNDQDYEPEEELGTDEGSECGERPQKRPRLGTYTAMFD